MSTVRVSSKGEIILPLAVRKALGLKSGMQVDITVEGNSVFITPIPAGKYATLKEIQALLKYSGPTIPISAMRVS